MLASRIDNKVVPTSTTVLSSVNKNSTNPFSPHRPHHEVERYAHALKARLELASFKALHGIVKSSITELDAIPSPASAKASDIQPLSTSPMKAHNTASACMPSSNASTPALSQTESMPSSSQSSSRSTRSIYLDIFGTDFKSLPSSSSASSKRGLSRSDSVNTTPNKRRASKSSSGSSTTSSGTRSLLDRTASSPQLGSPERKNGRFDWHNNPTPAMVAREEKLASAAFALPTGSPSKRRREGSQNIGQDLLGGMPHTPRRVRVQSNGGFLPNGHPASSLAQDLGLTTPRTPRSRQASGRQIFAVQHHSQPSEQDQEERDRVASTLAVMAEARTSSSSSTPTRASNTESGSSSSSSSSGSGSDHPRTPPSQNLLISSLRRTSTAGIGDNGDSFAHPGMVTPKRAAKHHRRNVSWSALPPGFGETGSKLHNVVANSDGVEDQEDGEQDKLAADSLLFLASSPSPSSVKRFSSDHESVVQNGVLATPAHNSLWDPFKEDSMPVSSGKRMRESSAFGSSLSASRPVHHYMSTTKNPLTPPPTARKVAKFDSTATAAAASESPFAVFGLGLDAESMSSPTNPSSQVISTISNAGDVPHERRASNAEEYMLLRTPRSPRTPPPSLSHLGGHKRHPSGLFEGQYPATPPNAPGMDTTFHYADFVNVSPSPQPPSTGRFLNNNSYLHYPQRTPTKSNRYRFDVDRKSS